MKLKLLTPENLVLERAVVSVTLPGAAGQFTVLDGHDRLVAALKPGPMYFRYLTPDNKPAREDFTIGSGVAEVTGDTVKVFVEKNQT